LESEVVKAPTAVIDLVVTHGPSFGILDVACGDRHQGCAHLLVAIRRVRLALHVFGHIHKSYGVASMGGAVFVNAALAGPGYRLTRQPIVVEYKRLTRSIQRIGDAPYSDPVGPTS